MPVNGIGRPYKFNNIDDFDKAINEYLQSISYKAIDDDSGLEIVKYVSVPSLAGLSVFCNCSKDAIMDTADRDAAFSQSYKKFLTLVENYKQSMLYGGVKNPAGVIFDLKCNHGYQEVQKIEMDINDLSAVKSLMDKRSRQE